MTQAPRPVTSDSGHLSQIIIHGVKNSRRKSLRIWRLKYTCQRKAQIRNGTVAQNGDVSLKFCSSSRSRNGVVSSGVGDRAPEDTRSIARGSHGWVSVIGRRREMEDAVTAELEFAVKGTGSYDFYAVYDGHSGAMVADACRERLHTVIAAEMAAAEVESGGSDFWERVMAVGFSKMDDEVGEVGVSTEVNMVGSTAVVAIVGPEEVVVANCGDSRAVLSRGGVAVALSVDHKPDRVDELKRIEGSGGKVINWNGHRVLGVLATSRSIGDHYLKPYVICKPEVTITERTDADEFLILGSDGLWDVVSNETACQYVRKCLNSLRVRNDFTEAEINLHENRAAKAAALLAELSFSRGSKDNISVVVIELKKPKGS